MTGDSNFLSTSCRKKSDFCAALKSVHNSDIEACIREIPKLAMEDKAVNIFKKYFGVVNRWTAWAKSHGFEPLPAMSHAVAIYIVFLMQTTQSIVAINLAIYGLNPSLYEGRGKFAPQAVFRYNSKTVGARLLKLCDFYC